MADMRRKRNGSWFNFDRDWSSIDIYKNISSDGKHEFEVAGWQHDKVMPIVFASEFSTREEAQQWLDDFMKGEGNG